MKIMTVLGQHQFNEFSWLKKKKITCMCGTTIHIRTPVYIVQYIYYRLSDTFFFAVLFFWFDICYEAYVYQKLHLTRNLFSFLSSLSCILKCIYYAFVMQFKQKEKRYFYRCSENALGFCYLNVIVTKCF